MSTAVYTSAIADLHSRSGDVVEQIMKPQWWISCKPMAEEALKVCTNGITVFPR